MRPHFLPVLQTAGIATLLCLVGALPSAEAEKSDRKPVTYDGKPLSYWCEYLHTELKLENRIDAVRALRAFAGRQGYDPKAAEALADLVEEFGPDAYGDADKNREAQLTQEVARTVVTMGPQAVEVLLRRVKNPRAREFTEYALQGQFRDPARGIPLSAAALTSLVEWLQGDNDELRKFAAHVLKTSMGNDKDFEKTAVAALLGAKRPDRLTAGLSKLVEADEYNIRIVLAAMGTKAKAVTPALAKATLRGPFWWRSTLDSIGADADTLVTLIPEGLAEQEATTRAYAAGWLGEFGPRAKPAVPRLLKLLDDPEPHVQLAVISALGDIHAEPEQCVPGLVSILRDLDRPLEQRIAATAALGHFGAQAKSTAPQLLEIMTDEGEGRELRGQAMLALKSIGNGSREFLPQLKKLVKKEFELPNVQNYLVEESYSARLLEYFASIAPPDAESAALLLEAFERYSAAKIRPLLAEALGRMGPLAKEALPALREAMKQHNAPLRKAAASAIEHIAGKE